MDWCQPKLFIQRATMFSYVFIIIVGRFLIPLHVGLQVAISTQQTCYGWSFCIEPLPLPRVWAGIGHMLQASHRMD